MKLQVIWGKTFLGLTISQIIGSYELPVTKYYFWPRTKAWEQLKLELESKPWIKNVEKVRLLNLISELLNFRMREYQKPKSREEAELRFPEINFIE